MKTLLDVRGATKRFRGLTAVDNVSLSVVEGEIFAVIGPNGAGKTTLFNLIAGVMKPDAGSITFAGAPAAGVPPHELCRRGLARTFQIVRPFPELTVMENATIGAMMRAADMDAARKQAAEVLRRLDLWDRREAKAKSLTLPDRKRLECARALATEPRLLLLDEVMAGLRPTEVDRIVAILKDINREGVTILLIEHVMRATMALAQRIHVLHHGATIAEGTPDEVTRHPKVLESYLGAEAL
ncbi:MAG: ABC transporter ATP-binding protein [Phreatobacter sp.]|uniref:ABC transporter ATP-binding protein n=1 Tax=Phreatobacter sp. TaxID=1966341 RepID=UPI001A580FFB|nr:ABC transporter ATP-binding protein [Phreatobacter sp.]MBL8568913.1 ABC transporter ATP-binding protein [Phreatobacter sp.]